MVSRRGSWAAWKSSLGVLSLAGRYLSAGWYIAFWVGFCVSRSLPSCPTAWEAVCAPAERQRSNKQGGKEWVTRLYSKCCELWAAKPGMRQELELWQRGHTVQEGEVFCLVSAAGCCARPAPSPACLDYPFYSGLKTACKFFYHSFPDCVECIVALPCLFPHLFSKLITFMLLGSLKELCLFPCREFIFFIFGINATTPSNPDLF